MAFIDQRFAVHKVIPHVIDCTRELYRDGDVAESNRGLFITNEGLYYILPIVLTIGLIFSLINTIVSARMSHHSHECYLTAFNLSCSLLLICACISQLPNYVNMSSVTYRRIMPYLPAIENWFWYSCSWLLITIVTERTFYSLCGKWHGSFGKVHGALVALLIIVISFVSTLPQYWEYRLEEVSDTHGNHRCNRSVLIPRPEVLDEEGQTYIVEYAWFHWYEMIYSIALPYLFLPMLLPPLICIKVHIYTSMPSNSGKSSSMKYSGGASLKDQLRQERSFNRLMLVMTTLYLCLSGPRCAMKLFHNPPISIKLSDHQLLIDTLQVLFDVFFYIFFSILFFLYLGFGLKFRTNLYHLCCCKKHDPLDYY